MWFSRNQFSMVAVELWWVRILFENSLIRVASTRRWRGVSFHSGNGEGGNGGDCV